ncbi:MAG: L,D-transpeptidase [Sandaracinaceae bacterium]|nr:L,D-transpeptidase [Sandaracinaceae bacterium]
MPLFRRRWMLLSCLLALSGCGEAEVDPIVLTPSEAAPMDAPFAEPEPVEVAPPARPFPRPAAARPAPPPTPAPDPEELARAAAERERLAFEREYPWHGVAYHFLAQVHARPDERSEVIGYMRRGAQFRAKAGLRGPGCARGWHGIPGGGFVCRGGGFQLGDVPQTFDPSPVLAATDNALPYAYAWVARNDVPQYWRLPSRAEEQEVQAWIERRHRAEERAREAAAAPPEERRPEPDLEAPPGLGDDAVVENVEPADGGVPTPARAAATQEDVQPAVLRMRMQRGFYVSIDRLEVSEGRRFYRTIRGAYVPADAVVENQPSAMRGVTLGARWQLPMGFIYRGGVRSLSRAAVGGTLRLEAPLDRFTALPLSEEVIVRRGQRYRVEDRGRIVREDALRIARAIPRPAQIPANERWVHVNLAEQVLVAYEGDRPVFATMVSTGREGFSTPTGTFRIASKHVSATMDDPNAGEEAYSIEDVPWTMYFEGSYALHAAFWHDRFGHPRSHGCVNLAPTDARWVFMFTTPELPPGLHGMSATRAARGTWVHITQ